MMIFHQGDTDSIDIPVMNVPSFLSTYMLEKRTDKLEDIGTYDEI